MIKIFICENEDIQRNMLCNIIEKKIMIEEYEMELSLSAASPEAFLEGVTHTFSTDEGFYTGMYFLDLDLNAEQTGFDLARKIREIDPRGFIVIITTHSEMLPLTFRYMIEPLDYIIKSSAREMERRIQQCMEEANNRYLRFMSDHKTGQTISFSAGKKIYSMYVNDILYITTTETAHKLQVCCTNKILLIRGSITGIEKQLPDIYFKISRETVVNTIHIREFNETLGVLTMDNDMSFQITLRKTKELRNLLKKKQ